MTESGPKAVSLLLFDHERKADILKTTPLADVPSDFRFAPLFC